MIMQVNPPRRVMQALASVLIGELQRRGLADVEQVRRLQAMQPDEALDSFFAIAGCPAVRLNDGEGRFIEVRPSATLAGCALS